MPAWLGSEMELEFKQLKEICLLSLMNSRKYRVSTLIYPAGSQRCFKVHITLDRRHEC